MKNSLIALVTGSNKGIGVEICRQLAEKKITVILTARDRLKGGKALRTLTGDNIEFHQLDITDDNSIKTSA